jgi:N-acetylmuramoyl-L-alanine amidase
MRFTRIKGIQLIWLAGIFTLYAAPAAGQASAQSDAGMAPFTVVLDAGHGGHDPGNLGNGYLEKNIALNIVLEVGKVLEKVPNTNVIYTRKDDSFVDLYVRGEIANKAKADLFVSVHCDSHTSNAHGAGTFVLGLHANKQNFEIAKKENSVIYLEDNYESRYAEYDINSPESVIGLTIMQEEFLDQSIELGKLMQDRFTADLKRNDRKVKQAGFIVLHQTFMPSVLVETGFLTNKDEGRYLNSPKGQAEIGQAIADAILEYRASVRVDPEPRLVQADENPAQASVTENKPIEKKIEAITPEQTGALNTEPNNADPTESEVPAEQVASTVEALSPEKQQESAPTPKVVAGVSFKIQLLAVSKDPSLDPAAFNGLQPLSKEKHQSFFRVLYGDTNSYEEAKRLQTTARVKGYESAYIVAYKAGKRIPINEAVSKGPL